jgi:heterodisulfide reductase subunit B
MPVLGIDLVDADNYVCCPAFGAFPSADEEAWMATSGWNLSIAEQKGCDFVVQCGSCYSSLRMGREHLMLMLRNGPPMNCSSHWAAGYRKIQGTPYSPRS